MWWPNHIVPLHVSRVAKNIACCVWKTSQDCVSVYMLWRFKIWENHFNSHTIITVWWGTIIFKVHPITPTSPSINAYNYIKSILIFLPFIFLCIFFFLIFKQIMNGHVRYRKKKYPIMLSFWHSNFVTSKHTNVIDIALLLCRNIYIYIYIYIILW